MSKGIDLAIIEDAKHVRDSLEEFFHRQEGVRVILIAESIEDFFEKLSDDLMPKPDIILSDINLPGVNGIEGIKKIKAVLPQVDVIMLTVFNDSNRIFRALCAGATGYALKGTPMPEILNALLVVKNGGSYMSPSIARKVIEHFAPVKKREEDMLSSREKQIIQALTEGLSYKLVADRLTVSIDTVRTHIKNIYRKLHVNSKAEVISKALKGEI